MDADHKYILNEVLDLKNEIKAVRTDLVDFKVIQGQNQVILQEHIRRTEANENLILVVKDELAKRLDKYESFKWYFAGLSVILVTVAKLLGDVI